MSTAEELLREDVQTEYARSRSYYRVARTLDLSMDKVRSILQDYVPPPPPQRESLYGGQGRPELRKYIVATKDAKADWDNSDPDILVARSQYEAGTHEMCTGRDGETTLLYSIPRVTKQPRPGYFNEATA